MAAHEEEKAVLSEPREEFQIPSLGTSNFVPSHKGRIKVDIVRSFTQRKAVHMGIVVRFFMMSSRRIERVWQ